MSNAVVTKSNEYLEHVADLASRLINRWSPHKPFMKEAEFMLTPQAEVLYGGAAGGGKSDALLMAALMFVDVPGYSAMLFRRTYVDLALPDALMDRANNWLRGSGAHWYDKSKTWKFPSGATVSFGYMESENDRFRYQGAQCQFIGFDELTQFSETQYRYLFSRLRRLEGSNVPLRMRSASNPGGRGHDWVKRRFISENNNPDRVFIPARISDNPALDQAEYEKALKQLDPTTCRQLMNGDWDVRPAGSMFKREWFEILDKAPEGLRMVRFWDMAATERKPGTDPDYTAGLLMGLDAQNIAYVMDVKRLQGTPQTVEAVIKQTAAMDGKEVLIVMEQEPGAAGKQVIDYYRRHVLLGYAFAGFPSTGAKPVRAKPVSGYAQAGNVKLIVGAWNNDYLDEVEVFPSDHGHDDQVDTTSGAFGVLVAPEIVQEAPVMTFDAVQEYGSIVDWDQ
ncbi:hypothetical protein LCGC14_2195640, partial [marine sediment metagenome]